MTPKDAMTQETGERWEKCWTEEFVLGKRLYQIWEHKNGVRLIASRVYEEHADQIIADHRARLASTDAAQSGETYDADTGVNASSSAAESANSTRKADATQSGELERLSASAGEIADLRSKARELKTALSASEQRVLELEERDKKHYVYIHDLQDELRDLNAQKIAAKARVERLLSSTKRQRNQAILAEDAMKPDQHSVTCNARRTWIQTYKSKDEEGNIIAFEFWCPTHKIQFWLAVP